MGGTGAWCRARTREQFFHAELEHDLFIGDVIDYAVKGTVIYMAVKHPDGYVYGAVVQTYRDRIDKDYWIYKAMSEDEGPRERKCPLRILRLLSPTDNPYAIQWREECYRQFRRHA